MDILSKQSDKTRVIEVIESSFDAKKAYLHCHSVKLYRFGVVSGLPRYRCRECQKTFNALPKTPLARLRQKGRWLTYFEAMAHSRTVRQSAAESTVHRNTRFRWRHRFLRWLSQDRPALLQGITEVNETHFLNQRKARNS